VALLSLMRQEVTGRRTGTWVSHLPVPFDAGSEGLAESLRGREGTGTGVKD
jgi:translation initiation factor 1 (eIF-1/SUI1)